MVSLRDESILPRRLELIATGCAALGFGTGASTLLAWSFDVLAIGRYWPALGGVKVLT